MFKEINEVLGTDRNGGILFIEGYRKVKAEAKWLTVTLRPVAKDELIDSENFETFEKTAEQAWVEDIENGDTDLNFDEYFAALHEYVIAGQKDLLVGGEIIDQIKSLPGYNYAAAAAFEELERKLWTVSELNWRVNKILNQDLWERIQTSEKTETQPTLALF